MAHVQKLLKLVKNVVVALIYHLVPEGIEINWGGNGKSAWYIMVPNRFWIKEIDSMMEEGCHVNALMRKIHWDKIVDMLNSFIFDFLMDDDFTGVDTNKPQLEIELKKRRVVPWRIWQMVNKKDTLP